VTGSGSLGGGQASDRSMSGAGVGTVGASDTRTSCHRMPRAAGHPMSVAIKSCERPPFGSGSGCTPESQHSSKQGQWARHRGDGALRPEVAVVDNFVVAGEIRGGGGVMSDRLRGRELSDPGVLLLVDLSRRPWVRTAVGSRALPWRII
jgi:hypothetical protein